MGTITLNQPTDMSAQVIWPSTVSSESASMITAADTLGHSTTYLGSFVFDAYGNLLGGTLTGENFFTNGVLQTSITNGNFNALTVWNYNYTGNSAGLWSYLYGGNDTFVGSPGADVIQGHGGNDSIDGGAGIDTVVYVESSSFIKITPTPTGFTVQDWGGTEGTDTLTNVERLKLFDLKVALDMGVTQAAGETALLLGGVLGKNLMLSKQPLLGDVISLFDEGYYTFQQLSGAVMRLPIWTELTGHVAATNTDIANYLLTTVNGHAPDTATLNAAVNALDTQTGQAQGDFLASLAASEANQTQINLVGLQQTGLNYL